MNLLKGETGSATVFLLDYSYITSGTRSSSINEYSVCVLRSPDPKLSYFYLRYQVAGVDRLGLAIAKQIITHHGGKIWAESQLGRGSTSTFVLPT
jgi:hypothetical protein